MKRLSVVLLAFWSLILAETLQAQQIDAQFGLSGIKAPSATNFDFTNTNFSPQSLDGGVYPDVGADFIIWHNLGINGEVTWKASRGQYQGQVPYRPILYDFNAVYSRKVSRVGFAAMGGIGAESIRFYVAPSCGIQCTNFVSSNHLLGHVGAAVRLYVTPSIYIAPEIHEYFVRNNQEFTSAHATRYALNVGFTFGK